MITKLQDELFDIYLTCFLQHLNTCKRSSHFSPPELKYWETVWAFAIKFPSRMKHLTHVFIIYTDGSLLFYKNSKDLRGNSHSLHSSLVLTDEYMMSITFFGDIHLKNYWTPGCIKNDDFLSPVENVGFWDSENATMQIVVSY